MSRISNLGWVAIFSVLWGAPLSSYSAPSGSQTVECPKETDFRFATQKDCSGVCETVFQILRDTSRSAKESWRCKDYAGHISLGDVISAAQKPKLGYWKCEIQTKQCSGDRKKYTPITLPGGKVISHKNWQDFGSVQCPQEIQNRFSSPKLCQETCTEWYRVFRNKESHNNSSNVGSFGCSDQSPGRSLIQLVQGVKQVDYGFWKCHLSTPACKTAIYPKNGNTKNATQSIYSTKTRDMGAPSGESSTSTTGQTGNAR